MPPTTQDDSPLDMQQLLDEMEFKSLRRGEIVEGTVMRADPEGIYLDIGHKEEGFIPPNEMRTLESGQLEAINEGDPLIAFVIRPDSQDGPILSIDKAKGEEGWRDLQKYMEADETIEGKIIGLIRKVIFIKIDYLDAEGVIILKRGQNDSIYFDKDKQRFLNRHSSEEFNIGSRIPVTLIKANELNGSLTFRYNH